MEKLDVHYRGKQVDAEADSKSVYNPSMEMG